VSDVAARNLIATLNALLVAAIALICCPAGAQAVQPTPPPSPTGYATPTALPTFDGSALQGTDLQRQLLGRDKAQISDVLRIVDDRSFAFLAPPTSTPGSTSTLVLAGRPEPYDLATLVPQFPEALELQTDGTLLVTLPILVGRGATLTVNSSTTPALHLLSGPDGYAHISAIEATVNFTGDPTRPLKITSHDRTTGAPDTDLSDGRAYIGAAASRMDFDHTQVSWLGFLTGLSSGVAWFARDGTSATGSARDSTFSSNFFGAYTSGADGLIVSRSQFNDNMVYGFDPHTLTVNTVVENSVAAGNGRHGFIFSSDCHDNVIRDSQAYLNGGAGFVIDDGRDDGDAELLPSNRNILERVISRENADTGIVIEGGSGNVVTQAQVDNNPVGIWVKNGASGTGVSATTITNAQQAALRLNPDTTSTSLTNATIAASAVGVAIDGAQDTSLSDVTIANASLAGITLMGGADDVDLTAVAIVGAGESTVTSSDPSLTADSLPGLDTTEWASSEPEANRRWDSHSMIKMAPWLLILGLPALLWLPIRSRWRRRHPPPIGGLQ
jgi:hypothetical protein